MTQFAACLVNCLASVRQSGKCVCCFLAGHQKEAQTEIWLHLQGKGETSPHHALGSGNEKEKGRDLLPMATESVMQAHLGMCQHLNTQNNVATCLAVLCDGIGQVCFSILSLAVLVLVVSICLENSMLRFVLLQSRFGNTVQQCCKKVIPEGCSW